MPGSVTPVAAAKEQELAEQLVAAPEHFEREEDKRLFLSVRRELWEYEPLRASRPTLELEVRHGTVRLGGRVRTLAMKEIVGYICQRLDGVGVVRNELISDTEVVRNVADALAIDEALGPLCLIVDVRGGVVTLSGDLPDSALERRAVEAALGALGALDVVSNLVVRRPQRPPTAPAPKAVTAGA
jgi:osmotically-inducible protein OsmY